MVSDSLKRVDWVAFVAAAAIVLTGLPYQYSAAPDMFGKQLVWIALGLAAAALFAFVDYRFLLDHAYWFYGVALLLLALVLALPAVRNAHSWIRVPGVPFSIQPSEVMKLALVLTLARHLRHRENQWRLAGLAIPFALTLVPMALILKQPDLGTGILLPPLLLAVVFAGGARKTHLFAVILGGALSAVPMWLYVMKDYQKARILAFLDPERYEAREAYQLIMSRISIGSGGLCGSGLTSGAMNELDLLPDKHTDFIFGVIAEEGGFIVAFVLLALFLVLVLEGYRIAHRAKEPGGRLLAIGCTSLLCVQTLINIGVVTALLPTTGITLPLVSYGGSSMIVTLSLVGLLLNVAARRPFLLGGETFTGRRDETAPLPLKRVD